MGIDDKERAHRVLASDPINITAMRVMFKGEEFNKSNNDTTKINSYECPPLKLMKKGWHNNPQSVDFTGKIKGRLKVIGLFAGNKSVYINGQVKYLGDGRDKWVVRCLCGRHELRTAKSLKNIDNIEYEMCCICNQEIYKIKSKHGGYISELTPQVSV